MINKNIKRKHRPKNDSRKNFIFFLKQLEHRSLLLKPGKVTVIETFALLMIIDPFPSADQVLKIKSQHFNLYKMENNKNKNEGNL